MAKRKSASRKTDDATNLAIPYDGIDSDERILTTEELTERVPLDRSTIWRMVQEGRFPPPIRLTRSRIGWRWSSILTWLADRERNPLEPRSYFGRGKEKSAS